MTTDALPDVGAHPDRLVVLEAVHNFRDLGGYPTTDGRTTRWRALYRADGLHRLAGADLEVIRALGLRTVIDLRRPDEISERGAFPVDDHPVDYHHLSVLDAMWHGHGAPRSSTTTPTSSSGRTRRCWPPAARRSPAAIDVLAAPDALPAVFHCAAGKDRTGLLAMLVLGALGVPHEYIAADYALTAARMAHARAWYAEHFPDQVALAADVPSAFLAALPAAMARLIDDLCAEHGSLRAYVQSLGVSDDDARPLGDRAARRAAVFRRRDRHGGIAGWRPVRGQRRARSAAAGHRRRTARGDPADRRCLRASRSGSSPRRWPGASGWRSTSRR